MFCFNSVTHSYSPTLRKKIMTTDTGGKKTTQGLSPTSSPFLMVHFKF